LDIPSTVSTCLPAELVAALDEDDKGASAVRDANKRTALHFAARQGRTDVCAFLVDELRLPVDPEDDDGSYVSPLLFITNHSFKLS
jgi:ankyrin repeat protein